MEADDDAGRFLRHVVFEAPAGGIQEAGASGPEGDAEEGGEGRLGEVEGVADGRGEQGVEEEEAGD